MSDLREALDQILVLCNTSRTYTRRTQAIHEVAMRGLGMTAGQRQERHEAICERTSATPYQQREAKRQAKREAEAQLAEAPP